MGTSNQIRDGHRIQGRYVKLKGLPECWYCGHLAGNEAAAGRGRRVQMSVLTTTHTQPEEARRVPHA